MRNTAQIGLFKLVSEGGIGSGVRRIEALTGRHAYAYMDEQFGTLKQAAALLKCAPQDVPKRVEAGASGSEAAAARNRIAQGKLGRLEAADLASRGEDGGRRRHAAGGASERGRHGRAARRSDELKAKLGSAVWCWAPSMTTR